MPENAHFELLSETGIRQLFQQQCAYLLDCVDPVGVQLDTVHIGNSETMSSGRSFTALMGNQRTSAEVVSSTATRTVIVRAPADHHIGTSEKGLGCVKMRPGVGTSRTIFLKIAKLPGMERAATTGASSAVKGGSRDQHLQLPVMGVERP